MRLFGSVTFERDGTVHRFTASSCGPIELRPEAVTIVTLAGAERIDWSAVRELRGWSPLLRSDRC